LSKIKLSYQSDDGIVLHEFNADAVVLLGRSEECDVVFPIEKGVSGLHAQLEFENDSWAITDLKSRYGTFVNEQRVTKQWLRPGDRLKLGIFDVQVELSEVQVLSAGGVSIVNSINIHDFAQSIESSDRRSEDFSPANDSFDAASIQFRSLIRAFGLAGETLLAMQTQDEMLDSILSLLFTTFSCERGAVGLSTGDALEIEVQRKRSLNPNDDFQLSQTVVNETVENRNCVLIQDTSTAHYSKAASLQQQDVRSAMCAPLYHDGKVSGLLYLDSRDEDFQFDDSDLKILAAIAMFTAVGLEKIEMRNRIAQEERAREKLSRYSSPAVVERILNSNDATELEPEERELSVLFADLSGFTSMSETMSPREVASFLNGVFEQLTIAIFEQEGTVDKFIGDAIMAIFGAPLPQEDHALRAIRAAIRMQEELDKYNYELFGTNKIRMRIGVNSGLAVAGDIGSFKRRDYTVIGDTVNVASRLESSVAQPHQVVIGQKSYELAKDHLECMALDPIKVKGKSAPVQSYLVLGVD
jgi:adenylate cyclase